MNVSGNELTAAGFRDALHRWTETLEALRITLTEDRPVPGDSALADGLADATDDIVGWLKEAEASLGIVDGLQQAPRLLAHALRRQGEALFGSLYQAQLERLARSRGPEWQSWVRAVRATSEPLWARAADAVQQLGPARAPRLPDSLSHTTYHSTHFTHSDTINPSVH
jgi:hypothetical protein